MSVLSRFEIEPFLIEGCFFSSQRGEAWLRVAWGGALRQAECPLEMRSHSLAIYAPDFFLEDPKPWWVFTNCIEIKKSDLIQALSTWMDSESVESTGSEGEFSWQTPSKTDFQEKFADLQSRFERGELQKVVPVVFEKALGSFSRVMQARALKTILLQAQGAHLHLYGLWSTLEGILGATPELLFELNPPKTHSKTHVGKIHLKTLALAGTRLKASPLPLERQALAGEEEARGFLEDPKERKEHQWVVHSICHSLQQLIHQESILLQEAGPVIEVGVTQVLELPTLWHLLTPIGLTWSAHPTCQDEISQFFRKIIQSLHPTAALGAVPRQAGMHWLREQEKKFSRRRFGAPWGVVMPDGSMQCWVAIRNLQWDLEKVWFSAGCGVIAESHWEREWAELQGKLHAVKKYFGWESKV